MHPVITQAVTAERTREIRADAVAARRARWFRQTQQARRMWLFARIPRAGRGPASVPASRPLRHPRAV
jgi:hypothetical protein